MSEEQAEHTTDTPPEGTTTEPEGATGASTEETVAADRYKNAERKITEQGQENSKLREEVAEMRGRLAAQPTQPAPPPPAPEPKLSDDPELLEKFRNDPSTIAPYIDGLREDYRSQRQRDLQATQVYVDEQVTRLNPEYTKRQELIEKLDANPATKGWTAQDKLNAVMAMGVDTGTSSKTTEETEDSREFPGTGTGRRVDAGTQVPERDKALKAEEARIRANISGPEVKEGEIQI